MNAYIPHDPVTMSWTAALLAVVLLVGFAIVRVAAIRIARPAAWVLVVAAVVGIERLGAQEPAGVRMLAIIAALLYAMKAVVTVEARGQGMPSFSLGRWLGFAALWPGMRPGPFTRPASVSLPGAAAMAASGLLRMFVGVVLVVIARLAWVETHSRLLATLFLLPGLSLIVHFGIFNVVAGAWRFAGVDCKPLFRAPLRSTTLGEFWGRRWNLAFSEMTALSLYSGSRSRCTRKKGTGTRPARLFPGSVGLIEGREPVPFFLRRGPSECEPLYQPLVRRSGRRVALVASFLGSGLLHETAISVPVFAGFGLPLCYFALHGTLVTIEGRLARSGRPIDRHPWIGRLWTFAWLLLPLPILFHRPFLAGIVWPLIGIE